MVLGYDEIRPTMENYDSFLEKLVGGLEKLNNKEICLMIFGSHVRGDANYGRSDVDSVLVFPHDVVIDKKVFKQISNIVTDAQIQNNIPLEITPVDLRTMSDGRFNSYEPSYDNYFKLEGKILFGPDYRNKFKFEFPTLQDQGSLTNNLWRSRRSLLLSDWQRKADYRKFLEDFNTTLNKASRASKQIMGMRDGKLRLNRFSAIKEIERYFPQVDIEPLKRIKHLYTNLDDLDALYKKPEELTELWNSSLTFFEEMIKAYLDAKPRNPKE